MNPAGPSSSITRRIRAVILLASVIVLFATAAAFVAYDVLSYKAQLRRNLSLLAAVIADNITPALTFENEAHAREILGALRAEPDITVAALYDEEGKVFATYPTNVPPALLPKAPEQSGQRFTDDALVLFETVVQENKPIGTLYLRSSLRGLYGRLLNYGSIVVFVLLALFGAAFLLSALLQRRISQPILALSSTTRAIAERGDYAMRASKLTNDEVGLLTDSFNHMLEQIQQRERALRASEQALRDQLNLVNTITDNTPSCLWMVDSEGRCTFANPASERISGFKPDELMGRRLHDVVHHSYPDGRPFAREECPVEGMRMLHKPIEGLEVQFIHKDGHFYPVRCNARPITQDNKPVGMVIEVQDITDIVKAREAVALYQQQLERTVAERTAALRDTVQQLETFSYSIVHDMRAPLRTMRAFSGFIQEEEGDKLTAEGRDYLARIMAAAERLDGLINDVLSYSRVSKGEASLEVVSLDQLVTDIIREYPDLHAHAARIEVKRPLPRVIGNAALLTQSLSNLLGNAVKFVPKDRVPKVVVRAEEAGPNVRLWVEDNGIGIPPDQQHKLFGLFQRLTHDSEFPGTGVGLAIVKRAIERMNGSIGVKSDGSSGSRFWIELPRA